MSKTTYFTSAWETAILHLSLYDFRRDPQLVEVSSIPVEDNKCAICLFPFGETDPNDNEITAAQECFSTFDEELPFPATYLIPSQTTEAEM